MNAVNLDVKITSCINIVKQYPRFVASCITFGYYDEKWISIDLWHSFLFAPPRPPPEYPVSQAPQAKNPALHASLGGRDSLIQKSGGASCAFWSWFFPSAGSVMRRPAPLPWRCSHRSFPSVSRRGCFRRILSSSPMLRPRQSSGAAALMIPFSSCVPFSLR